MTPRHRTAPGRLRDLIRALREDSGQRVVVLVDEYDKPILDALDDPERAKTHRDFLRGFYGTVKSADAHIELSFFTGVSKFTRVSLFSDLNNLTDITLDPRFANVCGYTENDLDAVFAPELPGLDRERIREWYNGYNWRGGERVYNPYDILLFFNTRDFNAHWFCTATPRFLIEVLGRRGILSVDLDGMTADADLLSAFDVEEMAPEALLFQSGYLTIVDEQDEGDGPVYCLGYPNREVRQSLNRQLLRAVTPARRALSGARLRELFAANDFAGIEALFRSCFDAIPYEWHTRNEIARYEGVLRERSLLAPGGGRDGRGRRGQQQPWPGGSGLALRGAGVPLRVQGGGAGALRRRPRTTPRAGLRGEVPGLGARPVLLIGVEFSRETRNIVAFETAPA